MITAKHKMGLIFFPAFDWAISPTHPEREERLLYTQDQLREEGIFDIQGIQEFKPDIATEEDVMRCHFCFPDVASVVTESHMISAGGAIRAARAIIEGEAERAFALVRPPGHHAMKSVHGNRGFCNINNEAIMIEYIREFTDKRRIAIVDTDCHHGDGTQDIYWNDPNVLFISLHQDGRTLYPGSGHLSEYGGPNAKGRTINIPLPPHTSDDGFLQAVDNIILPILDDFKPDLIVNSAGQDNHYTDPITNMNFSAQGYAILNDKIKPDIAVLEGGYSIQGALPYVNLGIVLAMAGVDYSHVKEPDFDKVKDRIQQDSQTTEYINQLTDAILQIYFHPPDDPKKSFSYPGDLITRSKHVFYDTDGIQESQEESVVQCHDCAGSLILKTKSSRNPLSLGIEIPVDACEICYNEGISQFEKAKKEKKHRTIQLINRVDKEYIRL